MKTLTDGLFVLNLHREAVVVFFLSLFGWGGWTAERLLQDRKYHGHLKLPMALCLGSLVMVLLTFSLVFLGHFWPSALQPGSGVILLLGIIACGDILRRRAMPFRSLLIFGILIFGLLIVRLAFLKGLLLPPYDDSPEHYGIVQSLLYPDGSGAGFYSLTKLVSHYYHFGFHSIAAWLCSITGADAADTIALAGQLFLVISPLSIFLLAYAVTKDTRSGLVAALFAAFAWRMPAFASNWGKYPAITGLALFPAVIALWILLWPAKEGKRAFPLAILTIALISIHTRLLVCLCLALAGYLAARQFPVRRHPKFWEAALLAVLTGALTLLFGNFIFVYYGNSYLVLGLVGFLAVFAFYDSPGPAIAIALTILGMWVAYKTPTGFENISSTWLDQPFVEIVLYIPLSLLAGIGWANLLRRLSEPRLQQLAFLAMIIAIGVGFVSSRVIYPDNCCNYVKAGDLLAIQWVKENTPPNSVVWTAALKSRNYLVGLDAGVWVNAMSGRNVNRLRYDFDWSSPDAAFEICQAHYQSVYVYKGGMPYSFDEARLEQQGWLRRVFTAGETQIYQVKDLCTSPMSH